MMNCKTIFITGAGSGIGTATVLVAGGAYLLDYLQRLMP